MSLPPGRQCHILFFIFLVFFLICTYPFSVLQFLSFMYYMLMLFVFDESQMDHPRKIKNLLTYLLIIQETVLP